MIQQLLFLILILLVFAIIIQINRVRKKTKQAYQKKEIIELVLFTVAIVIYLIILSVFNTPMLYDFIKPYLSFIFIGGIATSSIHLTTIYYLRNSWSDSSETIEGGQLVTQGPFKFVRHPLYAIHLIYAILMLLTSAYLLPACVLCFILPFLRIHKEEALLREKFGTQYDDYAKRVKYRLFPFVY